jgi:putative ABC transport system ATP-binding protein
MDQNSMTSSAPIISLTAVQLSLPSSAGPVHILRGIDLTIAAGQTVAILGPSGSGKSSMMAIMTGLERATSGKVLVAGADFGALDEDGLALARRGRIGIVLQAFHLIPTMTALENVAIPLELSGHADPFGKAKQELELVGLGHRTDHYPSQLSGGEQQRVALARAAAPDPLILFADEPTGNLDGTTGSAIIDLMFELNSRRGSTLVLITHDPSMAERCQRIIEMRDGQIIADRQHGMQQAAAQ